MKMLLLCHKDKATTHLEQIFRDVRHQLTLDISLCHLFCLSHDVEDVRGFHQVVGEVAL